jgi:hypothetical protein
MRHPERVVALVAALATGISLGAAIDARSRPVPYQIVRVTDRVEIVRVVPVPVYTMAPAGNAPRKIIKPKPPARTGTEPQPKPVKAKPKTKPSPAEDPWSPVTTLPTVPDDVPPPPPPPPLEVR